MFDRLLTIRSWKYASRNKEIHKEETAENNIKTRLQNDLDIATWIQMKEMQKRPINYAIPISA